MALPPQVWAAPSRRDHQYEALVPPRRQGGGLQGEAGAFPELWGGWTGEATLGTQGRRAFTGLLLSNEHSVCYPPRRAPRPRDCNYVADTRLPKNKVVLRRVPGRQRSRVLVFTLAVPLWINPHELTPDLPRPCLLLPGCFPLLGTATLCVLGCWRHSSELDEIGDCKPSSVWGWARPLTTESRVLSWRMIAMLVQSGCEGWRGSLFRNDQFSLQLGLTPGGLSEL